MAKKEKLNLSFVGCYKKRDLGKVKMTQWAHKPSCVGGIPGKLFLKNWADKPSIGPFGQINPGQINPQGVYMTKSDNM